ncbi:hypothetical protein [Leptospira biflexa]|uniref:hypothetical protein n=1 Tax=Leptospira biflexa TaxID=172 RepID=UPI001083C906|nr:hypothetical protein [Leptospira biflexa]TGM32202.1 hypothetical protein EHQ80_18075 [Leptospira biflexa]TGM42179.1 hypothetical protein EHQ89_01305 [Leptospira biflexa]
MIEKLLKKDKPSLNDWSFRIPGILIFVWMIYLQQQANIQGNCVSEIKIPNWLEISSFSTFATFGLGMFLMPYLFMFVSFARNTYFKLKGIKENDTDLPDN